MQALALMLSPLDTHTSSLWEWRGEVRLRPAKVGVTSFACCPFQTSTGCVFDRIHMCSNKQSAHKSVCGGSTLLWGGVQGV